MTAPVPAAIMPEVPAHDLSAYRLAWVRASVIEARAEFHVCQCEEVTAREILEVRPPRYLDWHERAPQRPLALGPAWRGTAQSRPGQAPDARRHGPVPGPALPRAGRGAAGARRGDAALGDPARRLSRAGAAAAALASPARLPEPPEQAEHWDTWFGMHAQWRPFWEVPELYTVASNDATGPVASE